MGNLVKVRLNLRMTLSMVILHQKGARQGAFPFKSGRISIR